MTQTLGRSSEAHSPSVRVPAVAFAALIVIATCGPASAQICRPIS